MKYLLLSYTSIAEWDSSEPEVSSPEALEAFAIYEKFQAELSASGELVATEGLGHPSWSRTLRKQAGAVVVSDGPFAELKEVLVMAESLELEHLLRAEAPQVLGALVRRFGHFDIAEDAVQDALLAAAQQWPTQGVPDHPRGWLIRVATAGWSTSSVLIKCGSAVNTRWPASPQQPLSTNRATDESLMLLFLCCHPVLSPVSQVALTLRAVGGLTTAEIAHAYGVTEVAMGQRITRAKQQIKTAGGDSSCPRPRTELTDSPPCCRCCI
jgi:DNA-directed RNA polymerase specialized sigma24 family protein